MAKSAIMDDGELHGGIHRYLAGAREKRNILPTCVIFRMVGGRYAVSGISFIA